MKNCRVCAQHFFSRPLLRYENMPGVAQNFPDVNSVHSDKGVDLEIMQCSVCGLVQHSSPPVPYFRDVIRAAGYSLEMGEFRRKQFTEFLKKYSLIGKKVIEIGCGRGEYLSLMKECGARTYGIEHLPASVHACLQNDLNVEQNFIEDKTKKLGNGPFDAFFCLNFLEHIPDINTFLQGIRNNLIDDGIGLVEVPNFEMILRENMFCEFMTDHLYYFTNETLRTTLALNGFEVIESKDVWHDYILSAVVKKDPAFKTTKLETKKVFNYQPEELDLSSFKKNQTQLQKEFSDYLSKFPPKSVAIWGAGHQSLAIMSLAKLDEKIKYVFDSAPFKQNKYTPATHIHIVSPQKIEEDLSIKSVIVIGASYSDEIVRTLKENYRKDLIVSVFRHNKLESV